MKLQVLMAATDLIPTEHFPQGLYQLCKNKIKCTVVNQVSNAKNNSHNKHQGIDIYTYSEKGLSKSRNRNLAYITENICLITDQDILFKEGFQDRILRAFKEAAEADIIVFQIEDLDGKPLKNYKESA
ncbi:glycosyltransferase family A protein, partial [Lutimonas sp.]|uniref:glycosyltransferase family A protein n=1 Tax=Lutimonas sp. TaxID=1872403 RepID=UPI003D9AC4C5